MLYFEWAQKVSHRKGRMVPETALPQILKMQDPGYRSVYMFSESDAKKMEGSSKGFDQYVPHSNELIIDIDSGEWDLEMCTGLLGHDGFEYTVFSSGNKGYHVVLTLDKLYADHRLPYSQRKWVEQLGMAFDPSVYKHSSLISLEGRIHPVTKKRKTKLYHQPGKPLVLPLVSPPEKQIVIGDDEESLKLGTAQLHSLVANPPTEGNRHGALWSCSKSLAEAGIPLEAALEFLQVINDKWPNPKAESEVERAVKAAYEDI